MRGEVTVRIRCLMPEKLIDRATAQGARFADVQLAEDKTLVVQCDAQSARLLLGLCRRFRLEASVIRLRGLSALRRFVRQRITLAAGIACAIMLSAFFLSRLWIVDIAFTGELAALGDSAALSRSLEALDVRPGMGRSIDADLLAQRLLAQTESYSYTGVRLQGVRLLVEAAPEAPSPVIYDVNAARDLVCAREGIVVRVVARSGIPCVKPGDTVRRGQVLIRGEEQASKEQTRPIGALGEVTVRSWFSGEARLPLTQSETVDTGRRSAGANITLLGMEWPISEAMTYPSQRTERSYLPIGGLFIPLEIERFSNVEILRRDSEIPLEILRARARTLSLANARAALFRDGPKEYISCDSWVDYKIIDDVLVATTVIEIQSDAAVTREALQGG